MGHKKDLYIAINIIVPKQNKYRTKNRKILVWDRALQRIDLHKTYAKNFDSEKAVKGGGGGV